MKPLSQTQEKFPPGWLTQRPCGPHTPEAVAPGARGPASNPQLSITEVHGTGRPAEARQAPGAAPLPAPAPAWPPCGPAPTSAGPAQARLPGHRAVLAAHVVGAGAVIVVFQVVAAGAVLAWAWLT